MIIAVPFDHGTIFQHFGRSEQFKLYTVDRDAVCSAQVLDTQGQGHGALAGFLSALHVDVLICGGIGPGAQMALAQAGIRLFSGVTGSADQAVASLIAGTLACSPAADCAHSGHGCGSHSCRGACHD